MWRFNKLDPGEPERDPHEIEFFHTNEIAESVVREAIQNSLDAKSQAKVTVKFSFGTAHKPQCNRFLINLEKHVIACNISTLKPSIDDRLEFLIIEDFGTRGLNGNTGRSIEQWSGLDDFYSFWWREGKSGKTGMERGRWGLGKTTFHAASGLRAFWGYTIREEDKRELLMGKALLCTHQIQNDTYKYYAYFMDEENKPIESGEYINEFKKLFAIKRKNEPGLSIVIPFPDESINETSIIKYVSVHFFYPILIGMLDVEIYLNGDKVLITKQNLIHITNEQEWKETIWQDVNITQLLSFIQHAIAIEPGNREKLTILNPENPAIEERSFIGKLDNYRASFNKGEILAFRIPVDISKIRKPTKHTYFDIFMQKTNYSKKSNEYYIRSGITISGIRQLGDQPIQALFIAEDLYITEFLGDSENPSHTEWNERTGNFKNQYTDAIRKLRFIKRAILSIISFVYVPPNDKNTDILKTIFHINSPKQSNDNSDMKNITGNEIPSAILTQPSGYKIEKITGGFRIQNNDISFPLPQFFSIKIAYNSRKGNPIKSYDVFDFNLSDPSLIIKSQNVKITKKINNTLDLEIMSNIFSFEISGFDIVRDLVLDVKEVH